jgi:hypothetical protein
VTQFSTYEQAEKACEQMDEYKSHELAVKVRYMRLYKVAKGA